MKYTIIVPGLLKLNGQIAKYGEEVEDIEINEPEVRLKEGYVQKSSDFQKDQKAKVSDADDAEKEKAKADALVAHNKLLADYADEFKVDAPTDATDDQIAKALKNKKAIGA